MTVLKFTDRESVVTIWTLKFQHFYEFERQCSSLNEARTLVDYFEKKGIDVLVNSKENESLVYYLSNQYNDRDLGDEINCFNEGGIILDPVFFRDYPLSKLGLSNSAVHPYQFVCDVADNLMKVASSSLLDAYRHQIDELTPYSAIRQLFYSKDRLRELYQAKDSFDFDLNLMQATLLDAARMSFEAHYKPTYREVNRDSVRLLLSDLEIGFYSETGFIELVSALKDGRFRDGMPESLSYFLGGSHCFNGEALHVRMLESGRFSELVLMLKRNSIDSCPITTYGRSKKATILEPAVSPLEWGRYLAIDKYLNSHPSIDFDDVLRLLRSGCDDDANYLRNVGFKPKPGFDSIKNEDMADLLQQYALDISVDYLQMGQPLGSRKVSSDEPML